MKIGIVLLGIILALVGLVVDILVILIGIVTICIGVAIPSVEEGRKVKTVKEQTPETLEAAKRLALKELEEEKNHER